MNERYLLIVRCFQEELTEVPESFGVNMVISISRSAANNILRRLKERQMKWLLMTKGAEPESVREGVSEQPPSKE